MFCLKCGQEIPDVSQFCPHCGADIEKINEEYHQQRAEENSYSSKKTMITVGIVAGVGILVLASLLIYTLVTGNPLK